MKTLKELLKSVPHQWNGSGELSAKISGVQSDSRKIKPGELFVAVTGFNQDGHRFINEALKKGAQAVVLEHVHDQLNSSIPQVLVSNARSVLPLLVASSYDFPQKKIKCIGVTGTNGKTTTTFLIQYLLNCVSQSGLIGSIHYDDTRAKYSADNTTPVPEVLFGLLAKMVKNGASYCVMEISSHALDQNRTSGLDFSSAVFTNLTQDHLDYHHDFETYFAAKQKLFIGESIPQRSILNGDDDYGKRLYGQLNGKSDTSLYAINEAADFRAKNIKLGLDGSNFDLVYGKNVFSLNSHLTLKHNIYNLLAALATLSKEGFDLQTLSPYLAKFQGVSGRMERMDEGQDFFVFVDYAHTPDGLFNVLSSVQGLKKNRVLSVFGCGGDRDRTKRPLMGEIASKFSDIVILTTDNPRTEKPEDILSEMRAGINRTNAEVIICQDREAAIRQAVEIARPKDLVFIFGKGHENYQVIGRDKIPFSDQEIVRNYLRKKCLPSEKSQALPTVN